MILDQECGRGQTSFMYRVVHIDHARKARIMDFQQTDP